jgi:plastocyanin
MQRQLLLVLGTLLFQIGCGGGGSSTPDPTPDAPPVPVTALSSCPADVAATIMDSPSAFVPNAVTIGVGDVVRFEITVEHFVLPNTLVPTDPALTIGRGETKCFRFDVPGTYGFLCGVHSFTGTITVE